MNEDLLLQELRALALKLKAHNIPLILGGGYGLLLKANHIQRTGVRTQLEEILVARSTADLDIFITTEVITNATKTHLIREALDELGYSPVDTAKYYQFFREITLAGTTRNVKFDFLASPVTGEAAQMVDTDSRRIKPRGSKGFHAHTTPEAFTVEEHIIALTIGEGDRSLEIYVPHPFSYVLLKLFALRDQCENPKKEFGRHHAFDIYATWAMMTEHETVQAEELRVKHGVEAIMIEAIEIADRLFENEEAMGLIRLKEHIGETVNLASLDDFMHDIRNLFKPNRKEA